MQVSLNKYNVKTPLNQPVSKPQKVSFGMKTVWSDDVLDFVSNGSNYLEKKDVQVRFLSELKRIFDNISDTDFVKRLRGEDRAFFDDAEIFKISIEEDSECLEPQKSREIFDNGWHDIQFLGFSISRPDTPRKELMYTTGFGPWKKEHFRDVPRETILEKYSDKECFKVANEEYNKLSKNKLSPEEQAQKVGEIYLKMRKSLLDEEKLEALNDAEGITF